MLGPTLVLVSSLALAAVGTVVDGLFWPTLVGIALLLATAALGEARGPTRAHARGSACTRSTPAKA